MSRLLLIDGNNRTWAAFHAYRNLSWKGQRIGMIYGFPSMMRYLINKFEPNELIVVWDHKKSKHRIKIHPEYKSHRKKILEFDSWVWQKAELQNILYLLGIKQAYGKQQEADDMIYKFINKGRQRYSNIIIVSGDKDFNQLIDEQVYVYSETKKKLVTEANCFDLYDYHPGECVDYLSLVGDSSDNIEGYPGIGPKKARKLLDKYGSLVEFISSNDSYLSIDKDKLLDIAKKNRRLINLSYYHRLFKKELRIHWYNDDPKPKFQGEEFRDYVAQWNMKSIMSNKFIEPFKLMK